MKTTLVFDSRVDTKELGRRMDKAIKDAGLTVLALSFETRIGESLLRRYVNGKTEPGASNLAKIADALGVSADWLVQNTDDPRPSVKWDGKTERRSNSLGAGASPPETALDPPARRTRSRRRTA